MSDEQCETCVTINGGELFQMVTMLKYGFCRVAKEDKSELKKDIKRIVSSLDYCSCNSWAKVEDSFVDSLKIQWL